MQGSGLSAGGLYPRFVFTNKLPEQLTHTLAKQNPASRLTKRNGGRKAAVRYIALLSNRRIKCTQKWSWDIIQACRECLAFRQPTNGILT
jgi:hypothetical protein